MATETFVIESHLAIDAAFARVIDLTRVPEWDRGISGAEVVEGDGTSVGSRYEISLKGFDGQPTTAVYELTAVDAPHSFTMVGTHPDFRADDTLSFESAADGCNVTYEAGLTLLGDAPPLTDAQLSELFTAIAGVARDGLTAFLNP